MSFSGILPAFGQFSLPFRVPARVAVDTRCVCRDALFFALPGANTDGHQFLEEAAQGGAVAAVISKKFTGHVPQHLSVLRVEDPLATLQHLARKYVETLGAKAIAITGSIGKTTTKEFVRQILAHGEKVLFSEGNQNSQIGLPLCLLNNAAGDERWIVAEMSMTHPGHISNLISIVPPYIAAVVCVAFVHVENFSGLEGIARAKAEIFGHKNTEFALYNADTAHADILEKNGYGAKRAFSSNGNSAYWSLAITDDSLVITEEKTKHVLPKPVFPARHVYDNLLAAVSICRAANVSWEQIITALPTLKLYQRRLEVKELAGITFINDAYNATDLSMLSALEALSSHSSRRRVAVLGQMKELGPFSIDCHQRVGRKALEVADTLYCLGQDCAPMVEIWRSHGRPCFWTCSLEELTQKLLEDVKENDAVLLKGSRSNHLWEVIDSFERRKI
jgi:UDP-N-acetylmuramoyl-tripeptide--D-alanyl-D-alanine ligase